MKPCMPQEPVVKIGFKRLDNGMITIVCNPRIGFILDPLRKLARRVELPREGKFLVTVTPAGRVDTEGSLMDRKIVGDMINTADDLARMMRGTTEAIQSRYPSKDIALAVISSATNVLPWYLWRIRVVAHLNTPGIQRIHPDGFSVSIKEAQLLVDVIGSTVEHPMQDWTNLLIASIVHEAILDQAAKTVKGPLY